MSSLKKFDYRIKDNRKRNIFLCGIILVIVTIVGVKLFNSYATFSNETTTIDLANGNVVIPATHYLKELEKTNKNQLVYDGTTDNNLRYIGKDPDNYVEFNGELWRIIGVMNNIENETGKKESRIKLIRNEGLDNNIIFEWDGKQNIGSATTTYGSNDWTDSQLMMMLNPVDVIKKDWSKQETKQLYLIDETSKEVKDINQKVFYKEIGSYFNRINGFKPYDTGSDGKSPYLTDIDFTNLGLPEDLKNLTDIAEYNLGAVTYDNTPKQIYTRERSNTVPSETSNRPTTWLGYVGLMYPSDYGYATSGSIEIGKKDRNSCLELQMNPNGWGNSSNSDCKSNDWLLNSVKSQWTISPHDSNDYSVIYVDYGGYIGSLYAHDTRNTYAVRPVLYLKSSVKITEGKGTKEEPFKISL